MMLSNISAFASLKEFKFTSFESLLKKEKHLKQTWSGIPGRVTGAGLGPGCALCELWL